MSAWNKTRPSHYLHEIWGSGKGTPLSEKSIKAARCGFLQLPEDDHDPARFLTGANLARKCLSVSVNKRLVVAKCPELESKDNQIWERCLSGLLMRPRSRKELRDVVFLDEVVPRCLAQLFCPVWDGKRNVFKLEVFLPEPAGALPDKITKHVLLSSGANKKKRETKVSEDGLAKEPYETAQFGPVDGGGRVAQVLFAPKGFDDED